MKVIDIDFKEDGKKYFCKNINEVFEVENGNLIAATRNFSMAELLKLEFEEIKETKNPYARVNDRYRNLYYAIEREGYIASIADDGDYDNHMFNIANYFNNKAYAEYITFKESLMRRMDRFAWEHNVRVINWHDGCSAKYFIVFDSEYNELVITTVHTYKSNNVYFTSKEIAEKAIEEFKEDLMKLYTWKFDF